MDPLLPFFPRNVGVHDDALTINVEPSSQFAQCANALFRLIDLARRNPIREDGLRVRDPQNIPRSVR